VDKCHESPDVEVALDAAEMPKLDDEVADEASPMLEHSVEVDDEAQDMPELNVDVVEVTERRQERDENREMWINSTSPNVEVALDAAEMPKLDDEVADRRSPCRSAATRSTMQLGHLGQPQQSPGRRPRPQPVKGAWRRLGHLGQPQQYTGR